MSSISFQTNSMEETEKSNFTWYPMTKGGEYRKWYGNNEYVVNWKNNGEEIKYWVTHNPKDPNTKQWSRRLFNTESYFKHIITWSGISSGAPSMRVASHSIFGSGAKAIVSERKDDFYIGYLNSSVALMYLRVLSPTLNYESGHIASLPIILAEDEGISIVVQKNIDLSKQDWDSFETSWDFTRHPFIKAITKYPNMMDIGNIYLAECYDIWAGECEERFTQLKANEEELNRIFIDIYGLQDELTPEVEDKDVTVRKADLQRDIKSLLSYAVGCMFGRYSLDVPGLVLAGQPFEEKFVHASNAVTGTGVLGAPGLLRAPGALYLRTEDGVKQCTFAPDVDNVIPITDEEYLEDDIIARLCDWLKVVYSADTLEANLDYIAKALGNKGTTSREVIRNYFVNDFFKDHCQTYSVTGSGKRPIYWLFDSGKQNGFKALVYLHRYTPDTIGTLRVDYLHKMQRVYESEINRMQDMMDHTTNAREAAAASKRKDKLTKQLKECRDYDEKISHLALSRIALDLDDGVKVNYRKLQTAADGKFYEVLADSKNIMAKEKK